ncbi:MAG: YdcF family protein [Hoeflea sp.]|uniref:YdcF family protein n=1 Tax=Hoeflea sp. TaxID=1940281 RepID=UPI0032EEE506
MDDVFFVLSKLIWVLLKPETMFGLLLLAAVIALWRGRRAIALGILWAELALYCLIAIVPVGDLFLAPLENRIAVRGQGPAPDYIVVLGGAEEIEVSASRQTVSLNAAGERLLAAVALARRYPDARIIVSGASGALKGASLSSADLMARVLTEAGVSRERLLLERVSRNTAENATRTAELVASGVSAPTLLVTSAFHMPRSLGVFCAAGWTDLAARPVDYRSGNVTARLGWSFGSNLEDLNVAVREWIGLIAYRATGRTRTLLPSGCAD